MMAAKVSSSDDAPKLGQVRKVVQTTIDVAEASNGSCSVLKITTRDRPGLLVDIVRVLKDINLNVVSAEIDTEGALAKDEVRPFSGGGACGAQRGGRGALRMGWVGKQQAGPRRWLVLDAPWYPPCRVPPVLPLLLLLPCCVLPCRAAPAWSRFRRPGLR